ncbi:hypothetical protein D3C80_1476550 [compost metagenome]
MRSPGTVELQIARRGGYPVAFGRHGYHAFRRGVNADVERRTQWHPLQDCGIHRVGLVEGASKPQCDVALVPEHLYWRAVIPAYVHLGDDHLLRRVDLGQRHCLAIPVILGAGQRPVLRFCPFAACPVGAFARSTFGWG